MKESVWEEVEDTEMSVGYRLGIPDGTEEMFVGGGGEGNWSNQDVESTVDLKILSDDRCPRRLGLLGASDAIR